MAIAAAFHLAGFKARGVFQMWSPNVRPSKCRIDGKPIQNLYDFTYALQSRKPGDVVKVKVMRGADTVEAQVTLAQRQ